MGEAEKGHCHEYSQAADFSPSMNILQAASVLSKKRKGRRTHEQMGAAPRSTSLPRAHVVLPVDKQPEGLALKRKMGF